MSFALMRAVEQSALPRRERAVARAMAYYVCDEAPAPIYPGLRRLAQRTGYSERSIQRAQAVLEVLGVLTRARRLPNRPTAYWMHREALPQSGVAHQLPLFRPDQTKCPVQLPTFAQADAKNRSEKTPFPQRAQTSTGQIVVVRRQIGTRS